MSSFMHHVGRESIYHPSAEKNHCAALNSKVVGYGQPNFHLFKDKWPPTTNFISSQCNHSSQRISI